MGECQHLWDEVQKLKYELTVGIPQEMQCAIESGDLRENSEFSEVVTRQYFLNTRLNQLMQRLNECNSIDINTISKDSVGIGSIIEVTHVEKNKPVKFKLMIAEISDDYVEREYTEITMKSPIGKALYNKKINDEVLVKVPKGTATYKIIKITTIHQL